MHRCNHHPNLIMGSIMAIMGAALCATMSTGHIGFIRTAAAHEAAEGLPLGDRKISDTPRRGYVKACMSFRDTPDDGIKRPWVRNGYWYPSEKPIVEGAILWPDADSHIQVEADRRLIRSNGLPKHITGIFPIAPGTQAYLYDHDEGRIQAYSVTLDLPATPELTKDESCVPMGMIGVTKDGVALFNAFDAEGFDAPAHEIQDKCNGHPQFSGQYHYHNWSPCIKAERADAPVGWMLDGFPILGPTGVDGKKITNKDLDECHGRVGPVWMDGKLVTIYHYHFTLEYPYTIGCYRGHVDQAFLHVLMGKAGGIFQFLLPGGPPPPQQQPPQQPPPPR